MHSDGLLSARQAAATVGCCLVLYACSATRLSEAVAGVPPSAVPADSQLASVGTTVTHGAPPPRLALDAPFAPVAVLPVTTPAGGVAGEEPHPADWMPGTNTFTYCSGAQVRAVVPPDYTPTVLATLDGAALGEIRWSPSGTAALVLADQESGAEPAGITVHGLLAQEADYRWVAVPSFPLLAVKSLSDWLGPSTAAFSVWRGGGVQHFYAVDGQTGRRRLLFDTQWQAQRAVVGGRYHPSPDGTHVAVDDCCSAHLFVAATDSPDARSWISDPSGAPYQAFQAWLSPGEFAYVQGNCLGLGDVTADRCDDSTALWAYDVASGHARYLLDRVCIAQPSRDGNTLALVRPDIVSEAEPAACAKTTLPDGEPADTRPTSRREGRTRSAPVLALLDVSTGEVRELGPAGSRGSRDAVANATTGTGPLGRPQWSPDGSRLAVWGQDGDVWLVTPTSGQWQRVTSPTGASELLWSPDSSHLAVRVGSLVYLYRVSAAQ